MKTRQYIRSDVEHWLKTHPGVTFTRDDIAEDLGITGTSVANIPNVIRYLVDTRGWRIERVNQRTWIYLGQRPVEPQVEPEPAPAMNGSAPSTSPLAGIAALSGTGRLFEQVANAKNGVVLARDEDGALYRVEPFEL